MGGSSCSKLSEQRLLGCWAKWAAALRHCDLNVLPRDGPAQSNSLARAWPQRAQPLSKKAPPATRHHCHWRAPRCPQ